MFRRFGLCLASLAIAVITPLTFGGCAAPPTASRLQIGADYAELPKNDSFESAKYEFTNAATGEHRVLEIKNAHADPAAALKAFSDTQIANLHALETAVNRISVPGVTTTGPGVAPPPVSTTETPATGPPK